MYDRSSLERTKDDSYLGGDGDEFTLSNLDILTWKIEEKEWEYLGNIGATDTNALITIETNLIQNITMEAIGQIILPRIVEQEMLAFKKTEVGSVETNQVVIHNQSPHPLEIQFFMASKNYYTDILEQLLMESKIPFWVEVCSISLSFDFHSKLICEELGNLFDQNEEK